jgi:hypothetical protein
MWHRDLWPTSGCTAVRGNARAAIGGFVWGSACGGAGIAPKYPFSILDRVNSPEKLEAYSASITTSDVAHTGIDHCKELNAAFVDLIRLIMAGDPTGYHWHPRLKNELLNLTLIQYRNQQTGWWGESYIAGPRADRWPADSSDHLTQPQLTAPTMPLGPIRSA